MADFPTPEEFEQLLRNAREAREAAPPDDLQRTAPGLDTATRAAVLHANEMLNRGLDQNMLSDQTLEMGIRPRVAFDPTKGVSAGTRAKLSFDTDPVNQFKLLGRIYGLENVDQSRDGRFVIRNQINPNTGIKEDFHVNPIGFEGGDVAGMAADVLPMIGGALGARFGGKFGSRPATRFLGGLFGMAAGTELTAGGEELVDRLIGKFSYDQDIKPGSLAWERTKAAGADMMVGAFLAGGTKLTSKIGGAALGALGISTGESASVKAARELASKTGVKFPLTPGEAAEAPLLMRLEAVAKPSFGTVGVMGEIEAGKKKAEDELRRVFLGLPRTMSDTDLAAALPKADITGQKVLGRLGAEDLRLQGEIAKAKTAVEVAGTTEAQIIANVDLKTPLASVPVGEALRNRANAEFKSTGAALGAEYDAFFSKPEVVKKAFLGNSLADAAKQTEEELTPSKLTAKIIPSVDTYGNPTARTVIEQERIDAFVQGRVKNIIDGLKALRGSTVSPEDLKMIRRNIDDSIAEGIAIPGVDTKQLTTLRSNVTAAIEDSLRKAGGGSNVLVNEWKDINSRFAARMDRFDKVGIRRMLIKEGEAGSVGNAALARSIGSGGPESLDRYTEFKNFLGANSSEFRDVQRLARENVLSGSLGDTSGYISGASLRSNLRNLDPEVASELFGTSKSELHRIGEALSVAQGNLDVTELHKMAASGTLTAAAIPDLIAAEKARATAWGNKLIKAAAKGSDIGEEVIKPSEVVRNLTQMDPDAAQKILGILSDRPELLQDVRSLAVEDLWSQVQTQLKSRQGATSALIEQALGSETKRRTWKAILDNDVVENLERLSKIIKPSELSTRAFGSAGQMRATGEITQAEKGGMISVLSKAAERMLLGTLYTGPLKQMIVNVASHQDQGRLLNSVIASSPFVERVAERFGNDAPGVMAALRSFVEPRQLREMQIKGQVKNGPPLDLRTLSPEEFDNWLKGQGK